MPWGWEAKAPFCCRPLLEDLALDHSLGGDTVHLAADSYGDGLLPVPTAEGERERANGRKGKRYQTREGTQGTGTGEGVPQRPQPLPILCIYPCTGSFVRFIFQRYFPFHLHINNGLFWLIFQRTSSMNSVSYDSPRDPYMSPYHWFKCVNDSSPFFIAEWRKIQYIARE